MAVRPTFRPPVIPPRGDWRERLQKSAERRHLADSVIRAMNGAELARVQRRPATTEAERVFPSCPTDQHSRT